MSQSVQIQIIQDNFLVGAIQHNSEHILSLAKAAEHADIVVFPELALTGYPPEDLLFRHDFQQRVINALAVLCEKSLSHQYLIIGHPWRSAFGLFNAVSIIHDGQVIARYFKQRLPNYGVFDEKRYFESGDVLLDLQANDAQNDVELLDRQHLCFTCKGFKIGLLICEDVWHPEPIQLLVDAGVDMVISPNASPFHLCKIDERIDVVRQRVLETGLPIVYANHMCGQDELVFDGGSFALDSTGHVIAQLPLFETASHCVALNASQLATKTPLADIPSIESQTYQALVLGVRDYVNKNGFKGAVLGLSGGIDSALTLAIAVDALGADRVQAVMMPFKYTAQMSVEDAKQQAEMLGVEFDIVSIEPMYEQFMAELNPVFNSVEKDTTEENLQARIRGVLLMALSNKSGKILLTTGNKSENAVGYCTLYGDMCGGFAAIKDVPKMLVYSLSNYRNTLSPAIPQRVIDRPPSAELAPDQVDQDSLPPYEDLDAMLDMYVEQDCSVEEIIQAGYESSAVKRVVRLVDINEYKRRQSAIGTKVTGRNFGKDRRYPITSGFGKETNA